MTTTQTGWVFWAGTVGFATPVLERLDAASMLDVQRFSITPLDVQWASDNAMSASDLGKRIRDAGYGIVMDPLVNWYGGQPHPGSRFGRFSAEETLRMCEQVGVVSVNLIGQPEHDASTDQLVTAFSAVCDRMSQIGAVAMLEFTPISAISTLRQGWEIVRSAGHPDGGLHFDTWHFDRSDADLSVLEAIPGDRIFSVQISDASPDRTSDVRNDTVNRLLPGDGVIDLRAITAMLHHIDGLTWVGPEVISPTLNAMPTSQAAELADSRVRSLLSGL